MTASEEKFTRQTLLDVQPLTPNLFTPAYQPRRGIPVPSRAIRPARRVQAQRQYRLARLLDGFGAS
ncbi:oxidoreductase [Pseudomonas aeruginosa]|nr:oxidoreductase [Pseudomonas aeruginosa]